MRWARLPLIALALLGLACATLDRLRGEEGSTSGTGAGTAEPTEPEAQPGEATPTQVRRLELQATPTPFHVLSQDDPRVQLNLAQPDYFDYFDKPDTWFDYDTQGRGAYWASTTSPRSSMSGGPTPAGNPETSMPRSPPRMGIASAKIPSAWRFESIPRAAREAMPSRSRAMAIGASAATGRARNRLRSSNGRPPVRS